MKGRTWPRSRIDARRGPFPSRRATAAAFGALAMWAAGGTLGCALQLPGRRGAPPEHAAGGEIAFGSDGHIFTMGMDGSQRRLTRTPEGGWARDPAWAPAGARLAYAYTSPAARAAAGPARLATTDIWVMGADGSGAVVLASPDRPDTAYETPVWAPDGRALYVTYTALVAERNQIIDATYGVARVPLGDGRSEIVVADGGSPALSPDGTRLAYVTGRFGWGQTLYVADADGSRKQMLVPPDRLSGIAAPRFAPDGRRVVFSAVATAPITRSRSRDGAGDPVAWLGDVVRQRRARPVQAHGEPMDVFVVGVDGADLLRLTHLGADNPSATWSPTGDRLAVLAGAGVYLVSADGSGLTALGQRGGHGSIDWRHA